MKHVQTTPKNAILRNKPLLGVLKEHVSAIEQEADSSGKKALLD